MYDIAIKIGEIGAKASFALIVAIISAAAAVISAIIAGIFAWRLNLANKQHEKQWAYINKVSLAVDNGIEIFARMLFNKLLIAYNIDTQVAAQNLFLLQKDILVIESQLVVYGSLEIAEAVNSFKSIITQTPNQDFLKKWEEVYRKGSDLLLLCRKTLGERLSEKFTDFANRLTRMPPTIAPGATVNAKLIGSTQMFPETK
ncbi:MAG: hypothetical protein FJZ13_05240 [Candidatus Omnitrophica bacterium]|nr:hypothetical protein [Candidatus Omnitrophota bacterium]